MGAGVSADPAAWAASVSAALIVILCAAAAVQDVGSRRIANAFPVIIAVLALVGGVLGVVSDMRTVGDLALMIGAGGLVFAVGVGIFAAGLAGGGDVKLLAAVTLSIAPGHVWGFLLVVVLAGGVLSLLVLLGRAVGAGGQTDKDGVPYGVAIAAGAGVMWMAGALGP